VDEASEHFGLELSGKHKHTVGAGARVASQQLERPPPFSCQAALWRRVTAIATFAGWSISNTLPARVRDHDKLDPDRGLTNPQTSGTAVATPAGTRPAITSWVQPWGCIKVLATPRGTPASRCKAWCSSGVTGFPAPQRAY
jgi:hypothetical protein